MIKRCVSVLLSVSGISFLLQVIDAAGEKVLPGDDEPEDDREVRFRVT